jgi:outer membrane usher protein
MSNVTYDRRNEQQRIVVGDFIASSGDLGSSINLGGLSFSKIYAMNPYFIKNPLLDFFRGRIASL